MWPCKLCDSSLSTRYELLKHFRLRHFHHSQTGRYPCVYLDCPCTFTSWKKPLTHTYRTHSKLETAGAQSTTFSCQTCGCKELSTEKEYFSHINQHLRQYENVTCMFEGCTYQSNIYSTFNWHRNGKHNPHSLKDFKAGVVKVNVQSSPADVGPTFTVDIDGSLSDADADSDSDNSEDLPEVVAHGTLLSPTPKTRSDILEGLAEEIMKYTAYPKDEQLEEVAKALIQSHPCLLEKGTRSGYCGWKHYLKIKMMNFRSKLRYVFYLMGSILFPS